MVSRFCQFYAVANFRSLEWLPRYNRTWFTGDLVAGITVGAVVVPQSAFFPIKYLRTDRTNVPSLGMAYAKLANLPVEFGLYSSFVGVLIYFIFATSKEYVPRFYLIAAQIVSSSLVTSV